MSKARVPLFGTPLRSVTIETDATIGAVVGVNLFDQNGNLVVLYAGPADGTPQNVYPSIWRLLQEIPPNIVSLAALTGTGVVRQTGAGAFDNDGELGDLEDVDLVTIPPVAGDVLTYNLLTAKWIALPAGGAGGEGGIGIQIGTLLSSAITLPVATEVASLADGGYELTGDWFMWCYPSGSIEIDVWRDVFGTIPVVADSICGGAEPAIVGGTFASGSFTGPITVDRTDTLIAHINSNTNVKWVKLLLVGDRT